MHVNPVAAKGFGAAAEVYERARPTYPAAAFEWFAEHAGITPATRILDLGAGTGKLTRGLVATGAHVVAVEPVEAMRARLLVAVPGAEAVDGTAEQIPLGEAAVDVVAAGQAFHWFDTSRALPEIHRVLRPGGRLALFWNSRGLSHPLLAAIEELLEPHVPADISRMGRDQGWREAIVASPLFRPYEHRRFDNVQPMTHAGLRDRMASTSFIAAMDEPRREALLDEITALAAGREEPFDFPYTTDVFVFPRADGRWMPDAVPSIEGSSLDRVG